MTRAPAIDVVESFREAIAGAMGLHLDHDETSLLGEVLHRRAEARGFDDPAAYIALLSDPARRSDEVALLSRELCVGETYFLRNRDQFRALAAWLRDFELPRPPAFLSAGCSTGEEAYSIAMTAAENLPRHLAEGVRVVAVDVSPAALAHAKEGRYTQWSLRETPEETARAWLKKDGKRFVVNDRLRAMVAFEQRNLVDADERVFPPAAYDYVFCRNVLMYLTPDAARRVVEALERSLAPGGLLFLGYAENLRGISDAFTLVHTHDTFYYRKRGGVTKAPPPKAPAPARRPPTAAPLADTPSWFDRIGAASERIAALDRGLAAQTARENGRERVPTLTDALSLMREEKLDEADAVVTRLLDHRADHADALLVKAALLVTLGDPGRAEAICSALLAADELSAGAHYVMALCREHAGDAADAAEHDRIAAYLDPSFAMPRLHLGLLCRRAGDPLAARRELELAAGLLAREDASRIVMFGGGFTREALVRLCRAELRACGGTE